MHDGPVGVLAGGLVAGIFVPFVGLAGMGSKAAADAVSGARSAASLASRAPSHGSPTDRSDCAAWATSS